MSSSVITDEATGEKRSYSNDAAGRVFAVMDTELTITLSADKTANRCADILIYTEGRYFTGSGNMELTDSVSEALMRTVIEFSRILIKNLNNYEARAEIM